jgi:hypothetical protein
MAIVLDGTANTVTPLNGALGATTPSTVAATTVVASSTIKGATTIAVGNATPSASGAGITFPATQSASTDANTLDDYEEGTWTPNQGAGLTVVGTFSSDGTYTKIGRVVTLRFKLTATTSVALPSSNTVICSNLPFTPEGANSDARSSGIVVNQLQTAYCMGTVVGTNTNMYNNGTIAATSHIHCSITYQTT